MNKVEFDWPFKVTHFRPGSTVAVTVRWELEQRPVDLKIKLLWRITGQGNPEFGVLVEQGPSLLEQNGKYDFSFQLPELLPYSLIGELFNLEWVLEFVSHKPDFVSEQILVISNNEEIVQLKENFR